MNGEGSTDQFNAVNGSTDNMQIRGQIVPFGSESCAHREREKDHETDSDNQQSVQIIECQVNVVILEIVDIKSSLSINGSHPRQIESE